MQKRSRELVISVSDTARKKLAKAKVDVEPLGPRRAKPKVEYDKGLGAFVAKNVEPGRYTIEVAASGLASEKRRIAVGEDGGRETFILGKEGLPAYFRGRVRVPFEPPKDRIAVSVVRDFDEGLQKDLEALTGRLGLQPEPVADPVRDELVRVFKIDAGLSAEQRREIVAQLQKHPAIRRAGPLVSLDARCACFLTDEISVQFGEEIKQDDIGRLVKELGLELLRSLPYSPRTVVLRAPGGAGFEVLEVCERLAARDDVDFAEPNMVTTAVDDHTPNDFLFGSQPHLPIIQAEDAWDITQGSDDIIIAVVDSGCDIDHPDFVASGFTKLYKPFDFTGMDSDPTSGSHGTKSCGIATAVADNSEGVSGVAPDCRLMPIRRPSGGTDTDYADMYVWIAGLDPGNNDADFPALISPGADVISNSFGIYQDAISGVMQNALDNVTDNGRGGRGCVVVFSVGNDNQDFTATPGRQWAAYNRTIAVASSAISPPDTNEVKVSSSNFGPAVDVCAPGGGPAGGGEARTLTTTNIDEGDTAGSASASTNDYDDFGQTSCACPQVAGVAGLILSARPELDWDEVRDIIRESADRIDVGNTNATGQWVDNDGDGFAEYSQWYGFGRINALSALCQTIESIELVTPAIQFNDVVEGETAARAVHVRVCTCDDLTVEITGGPTLLNGDGSFGTTLGTSVVVSGPTSPDCEDVFLWITYTAENDGDTADGEVVVQAGDQSWTIPITANVIARPSVAVCVVLDQSGSMGYSSGFAAPFDTRESVLKFSAPPLVEVLYDDNGIGAAAFDQDPHTLTGVATAGPAPFGAGRAAAKTAIAGYSHNPNGATAIGDGVERAHDLLDPATGYDIKSTIVLTDGHETAAKYITDVSDLVDERIYAIGLGSADQIQPAALTSLTNGSGGYMLLTGDMDEDDFFLLAKYYLQILAGVTNEDIVVDPENAIRPGQEHRIPFVLTESDIVANAILLCEAPETIRFAVETPDGKLIDPSSVGGIAGMSYVSGENTSYYRFSLPVPIDAGVHGGTWHAVLSGDEKHFKRHLARLEKYPDRRKKTAAHGVRYSVSVHSFSNVRMRATVSQDSNEPGALLHLRAVLTEFGIPLGGRADVEAELQRPDGTRTVLGLVESEPGVFEAETVTTQAGVYRFRVLAAGKTFRGRSFTREQLATGVVWKGGDQPPPSSPPGGGGQREGDLCKLLKCLLSDKVLTPEFQKRLKELGIDIDAFRRCVEVHCRRGPSLPGKELPLAAESIDTDELRRLLAAMSDTLRSQ